MISVVPTLRERARRSPGADSSAWRERLLYKQRVTGSNPVPPRTLLCSFRVALGLLVGLGGCAANAPVTSTSSSAKPAKKVAASKSTGVQVVRIRTEQGVIRLALFKQYAPKTVANFVSLIQKGYYRNLLFHRVVPGVLIQGGDPKGDGTGGPGYTIKAEFNKRSHTVGAVAMARTQDPNSAGSQFYICIKPLQQLDGQYTVFGQVYEGMDVVGMVQKGDHMIEVTVERIPEEQLPPHALK